MRNYVFESFVYSLSSPFPIKLIGMSNPILLYMITSEITYAGYISETITMMKYFNLYKIFNNHVRLYMHIFYLFFY